MGRFIVIKSHYTVIMPICSYVSLAPQGTDGCSKLYSQYGWKVDGWKFFSLLWLTPCNISLVNHYFYPFFNLFHEIFRNFFYFFAMDRNLSSHVKKFYSFHFFILFIPDFFTNYARNCSWQIVDNHKGFTNGHIPFANDPNIYRIFPNQLRECQSCGACSEASHFDYFLCH